MGRGIETSGREFEYGYDLFPRHVEPLHDLLDTRPGFEIFENVETGIRVSLNTHAPLTLPGILSTAGHLDQSRLAMIVASFHRGR